MFRAWRKLIVEIAALIEAGCIPTVAQVKVCAQTVADANYIALTGKLPTHDFWDDMYLQSAESAEMIADLSTRSDIEKSMQKLKVEMMELSDSKLAEFKRDLMACPITDKDFETVQDMLAICESVQRAR